MITFERPELLVACLGGLLVFLALYWRVRARPSSMAYFTLWEEAVRASVVNRALPLIRMVRFLTTFLLLVTCALLIAGPRLERERARDWALVVDLSPSMDAREETGETRLELARRLVGTFLAADVRAGDRCALIAAGERPVVVARPDRPRATLLERLDALRTQVGPADLAGAVEVARAQGFEPVVFTDGQEPGVDFAALGSRARIACVGAVRANRAIVDLALRRPSRHGLEVAARVEGFGGVVPSGSLQLVDAAGAVLAEVTTAEAGWASIPVPPRALGRVMLRAQPADACAWDDEASLELSGGRPEALALSCVEGATFHPSLNVAAHVLAQAFDLAMRELAADERAGEHEVLVREGGRLAWDDVPPAGAVLIGGELEGFLGPVPETSPALRGVVLDVDREHPVSAGLPLDQLRVRILTQVPLPNPPGTLRALVAGPAGHPLLYVARRGERRVFGTAFPLHESDLPTGMIVVLLGRMLEALAAPVEGRPVAFLRAGPELGPRPRTATDVASGGVLEGDFPSAPLAVPWVLPQEGEVEVAGRALPVNAFFPAESDIGPRTSPGWSGRLPSPRATEPDPLTERFAVLLLALLFARALLDFLLGV